MKTTDFTTKNVKAARVLTIVFLFACIASSVMSQTIVDRSSYSAINGRFPSSSLISQGATHADSTGMIPGGETPEWEEQQTAPVLDINSGWGWNNHLEYGYESEYRLNDRFSIHSGTYYFDPNNSGAMSFSIGVSARIF